MEKDNQFQGMLHPILVQTPQTNSMTFLHVIAKLHRKGLSFPDFFWMSVGFSINNVSQQVPCIKMNIVKGNLCCYFKTSHFDHLLVPFTLFVMRCNNCSLKCFPCYCCFYKTPSYSLPVNLCSRLEWLLYFTFHVFGHLWCPSLCLSLVLPVLFEMRDQLCTQCNCRHTAGKAKE